MQNNRIIFDMDVLAKYKNRIFNLHNSLLPAFKGTYEGYNNGSKYPVSKIFERALEFGSLVMGVTVHIVENDIDNGKPVMVSVMSRAPDEQESVTRHKMFIQEVKLMLQLVKWLAENRYHIDVDNLPRIRNSTFDTLEYNPDLDDKEIIDLSI